MACHAGGVDPIIVVGAGISGVACARVLSDAGLPVVVVDRGRRLGGRMATRRLDDRPVDTGAQFFTVSDDRFATVVAGWQAGGLAHPWTDSFSVISPEGRRTTTGPVRWGSTGGMRSLVEALASGLDTEEGEVTQVGVVADGLCVDGRTASAVVLAMPDGQAARLLSPDLASDAAVLTRDYEPILALTAWWPERVWDAVADGPFQGAFVNDDPDLSWIADDGRRRGDQAPVLVAHSTPGFAAPHVGDPQSALPAMTAALRRVLDIPTEPLGTHLQRWSMAKPTGARDEPFHLSPRLLGVCGDGWGPVPKVEGAFLSGTALGVALVERLEADAQDRRDAQVRADLRRAQGLDVEEHHDFVRQLGFEELLDD